MHSPIFLFAQDPQWASIFYASYGAWAVMELTILMRDARAARGEKRDAGSRFAFMVFIPAGLFAAWAAPFYWPMMRIALPPRATFYTAIGLIWAGMALRLWAVITLGRFFRTSVFIHQDHKLVTSGPYRLLRHPSYTGAIVTLAGIGAALGNWISILAAAGGIFIACAIRIIVEERSLAEQFGEEFAAQKRRTWAIIPFIW